MQHPLTSNQFLPHPQFPKSGDNQEDNFRTPPQPPLAIHTTSAAKYDEREKKKIFKVSWNLGLRCTIEYCAMHGRKRCKSSINLDQTECSKTGEKELD